MAEITAIDAFVDAFCDCALCKQVLQKSPATRRTEPRRTGVHACRGPRGHVFSVPPVDYVRHLETFFQECQTELERWKNYATHQEMLARQAPFATPAVLDGRIYLRTEKHLFAFGGAVP